MSSLFFLAYINTKYVGMKLFNVCNVWLHILRTMGD